MPTKRQIKRVFYTNNADLGAVDNVNRSIRVDNINQPRENDNPAAEHETQQHAGINESKQAESQVNSEQHSRESTESHKQQEIVHSQSQSVIHLPANASNFGSTQNQSEMQNNANHIANGNGKSHSERLSSDPISADQIRDKQGLNSTSHQTSLHTLHQQQKTETRSGLTSILLERREQALQTLRSQQQKVRLSSTNEAPAKYSGANTGGNRQVQNQFEQREQHQNSEHQEVHNEHNAHRNQQAHQQTKQPHHGSQWQQDNHQLQQCGSSGSPERLYLNSENDHRFNTTVHGNSSPSCAPNQPPPPKYHPTHILTNTWQCGKCYQAHPLSVTTCPLCAKSTVIHGSKAHSDQIKASSEIWQCMKCSKVYPSSFQTCPCQGALIDGSAYSDDLNMKNDIWQRCQSNQPQRQHHHVHVHGISVPPDFQPPPVQNHVVAQRQQQNYQQHHGTYPNSNESQPQFCHPDSIKALVNHTAGAQDGGQRSSKYFNQSVPYQAPPRGKKASQLEQLRQPSRGKQASHIEQLRHKSSSYNSHADSSRQSESIVSSVTQINGGRSRQVSRSLIRTIEDTESIPQLEGIRHNLKMLLEKIEDKINRALVQKALDEFEDTNTQNASVSDDATGIELNTIPLQRVSCCPLCFSFEDTSKQQQKKAAFVTCPNCESSICQACQSKCILCERSCCFDCIHQNEGFVQEALCRDCGGKYGSGGESNRDSVTQRREQDETCSVEASNTILERRRKRPTEVSASRTQDKRPKPSNDNTSTLSYDGTNQSELEKHTNTVHDSSEMAAADDPKHSEPHNASNPSTVSFDHQPSSTVSKASTTMFQQGRQNDDLQSMSGKSTGSSSFVVTHIFMIQHEGALGMNIAADCKNKYAIIKSVEPGSPADLYGLKVDDRLIYDDNNPKITYQEIRDWVINRLKTRPTSLAVARKCMGEDGSQEPIYALESNGAKRFLAFDGNIRASLHRFVFNDTRKLGLVINEVPTAKGYTYTYISDVEPGSIAERHGVRKADILCKPTKEGRLVSQLLDWVSTKMQSKPPFRFEVIRIHKVVNTLSGGELQQGSPEASGGKEHNIVASLEKPEGEPPNQKENGPHMMVYAQSSPQGIGSHQNDVIAEKSIPEPALIDRPTNTKGYAAVSPKESSEKERPAPTETATVEKGTSDKKGNTNKKYCPELEGEGATKDTSEQGISLMSTTGTQQTTSDTLNKDTQSSQPAASERVDIKLPAFKIGTQLWKKFLDENGRRRPFAGKIVSYDTEEGFYKIVYEDGDEEELTEKQVTKLVAKNKKKIEAQENRPLLTGKLSRIEHDGNVVHAIKGYWHFDKQQRIASQTFELIRSVPKDGESPADEELPVSGEYPGFFVVEWIDQNTKEKMNTTIKEGNVVIEFERQDDNGTTFTVKGKGLNQYGIFELSGLAKKDPGSDGKEFNVRIYKKYANPNAAS